MLIAICDDDKELCCLLAEKVRELFPEADVAAYLSGEELISARPWPDILLLDIKMPGMDGMAAARALRDRGWNKVLLFVTGEEGQVFDAFDVHAFHFLVKPIREEKLKAVLTEAAAQVRAVESPDRRWIRVQTGSTHIRIDLSEVLYAEVFSRKTIVHTLREDIGYYGQLSDLEKKVGEDFFRVHRSFLVHLKFVDRYDGTSVTVRGSSLPLARRNYQGFVRSYMDYHLRKR